jgi:membrane fusion protein (multidrug efflux system)
MGYERRCKDRDRKISMKRFCWSALSMIAILTVLANPVLAAPNSSVSAQKTVTASAVIVPEQVSELGFLISGIAKEIPVKEGDSVKAGQTLIVLDTPNLEFAVTEAQASLRAAQAQAEIRSNDIIKKYIINYRKLTVRKLKLSVPHEVIELANASVQRAQASVEIAQANLAQGTLIAPRDGVVASLQVIPGEFVQSDQAIITLATLNDLQLETTDLSERDIPNVHMGDIANIFVEALNKNISGKVISISPIADTVGGDVVFKVTIAPDTQLKGLLWGMTAEVEIQGGK